MERILERFYNSLQKVFAEQLNRKEIKRDENNEIDVFLTYMTLTKHKKDFISLIESSSVRKESLIWDFSIESVSEAIDRKYIKPSTKYGDNMLFITSNGLYHYHTLRNDRDIHEIFIAYDEVKFPSEKLKLNTQEKIWCILLLLVGAETGHSELDTSSFDKKKLMDYFYFLKKIEDQLNSYNLNLGKSIGWDKGKNITFRKFLTTFVDLPKTGVYSNNKIKYGLDLSNRNNAKLLMDLILDQHIGEDRIYANQAFYDLLYDLSLIMIEEIGEIPTDLNQYIKEELLG